MKTISEKMRDIYNSEAPHRIDVPMWDGGYVFTFDTETSTTDSFEDGVDWMHTQALKYTYKCEQRRYLNDLNIPNHLFRSIFNAIESGEELSDTAFNALFSKFVEEMPYGTAKARTDDPYVWIINKLQSEWEKLPAYKQLQEKLSNET